MPDAGLAIRCEGVRKAYKLYAGPGEMALDLLGFGRFVRWRRGGEVPVFEALRGVDLEIRRGERIAIMGRNGAGKTTLLNLITGRASGNFAPTGGRLDVFGNVQALMASGLGFQPEVSGRANVAAAFAHHDLDAAGLRRAMDDVIAFSELDDYIDQPIGTYSAGMLSRLQFAVSTAVDPEILVIDEILGAGDAYFSMKSAERIRDLTRTGCTLVLVSHFPLHVLQFCERAVWLRDGVVGVDGPASEVMNGYEAAMEHAAHAGLIEGAGDGVAWLDDGRKVHRWPGQMGVKIRRINVTSLGQARDVVSQGEPVTVSFELEAEEGGRFGCCYLVTFWTRDGRRVGRIESEVDTFEVAAGGRRVVRAELDPCLLGPGLYQLSFSVYDRLNFDSTAGGFECRYDVLARAVDLRVDAPAGARAFAFTQPARWSVQEHERSH